jgi:hypothetical protein
MDKLILIGANEIGGINSITRLGNSRHFLELLESVDYHFILFSTLYQSGAKYFQLPKDSLPSVILNNPFWKDKFVDIDNGSYTKALNKAENILQANFNYELDQTFRAPQAFTFRDYLTNLFYSTETGISFVNPDFAEPTSFNFLESRMSKELFITIKNFNSLIQSENISTITPQYSVLKRDVRKFEDIVESTLYLNYRNSLENLEHDVNHIDKVKKDVHVNALKLHAKYAGNLDLKNMGFSFMKTSKKVVDLFLNNPTSIFGDYLIDLVENVANFSISGGINCVGPAVRNWFCKLHWLAIFYYRLARK